MVATLIRTTGDWDLAEECARRPSHGRWSLAARRLPRSPGAWLTTTARNRAIDRLRRDATGRAKLREVAVLSHDGRPGRPATTTSGVPTTGCG